MVSNEAVSGQRHFKNPLQFRRKKKQRTYIFPSRFGLAFGVMAFVLFFMALGYANNLIYIFVFFMISVAFTGMLITNRNIDILELNTADIRHQPLFATEIGNLVVMVLNSSKSAAWEVQALAEKSQRATEQRQIAPQEELEFEVAVSFKKRGWNSLPRLILQSYFPFGLLRAWKVFRVEQKVLVFPIKKGRKEFPQDSLGDAVMQSAGLFRDHRVFQSSDSLTRIDWRASSRHQQFLVKNYEEPEKPQLQFNWGQTQSIEGFEDRISQLALWIDEAEASRHSYALEVGVRKIDFGSGRAHWTRCLEVLAVLNEEDLS